MQAAHLHQQSAHPGAVSSAHRARRYGHLLKRARTPATQHVLKVSALLNHLKAASFAAVQRPKPTHRRSLGRAMYSSGRFARQFATLRIQPRVVKRKAAVFQDAGFIRSLVRERIAIEPRVMGHI